MGCTVGLCFSSGAVFSSQVRGERVNPPFKDGEVEGQSIKAWGL